MANPLFTEQLSRNRQFFGNDGQDNIENAFVIVVGLGGVGSHAAHMLARAGVKKLRLIDFDNVTSLASYDDYNYKICNKEDENDAYVVKCMHADMVSIDHVNFLR